MNFAFSDVRWKLSKMSRRSLVVFAEDPFEDSVLLFLICGSCVFP